MNFSKSTIRRLEKKIFIESNDYLVIPIFATAEEEEAIRQEAKRTGKRVMGIRVSFLQPAKKDL